MNDIADTTYIQYDKSGKKYYFRVATKDESENLSELSKTVSASFDED